MMRKFILTSLLMLTCSGVIAETENTDCVSIETSSENKEIILPGSNDPQTGKIYFIKNVTEKSIWLDHPVLHPSVSAGWSSYLRPNHLSAILVNRKDFNLSCAVIKPGKLEYLDCAKAISICVPKDASYKSNRKGTYWLAEDKPMDELMKALAKRGVKIK